jgi:glycosyltransferase involved in cell wall biosynthesis
MCFKSRIVVAEDSWLGSTTFGIAQGFRKLAWEVAEVSPTIAFMQGRSLPLRILGRLTKPINVALYNKEILQTVEQFDANVLLTVKGSDIQVATLKVLAARGVETINYYPDFRFSYAGVNQDTFIHYSTFITTKSFHIQTLEQKLGKDKVHFLHHGYCSDVHYPPDENLLNSDEIPDVLYVGTYTAYKEQLFTQLKQNSPDLNLMIFGHGWGVAKSNLALKTSLANRPVVGRNYAQIIHAAKINLAIHMGPADDSGWQDLVSTRSFEIPACKGFMLHIDNSEIRTLYDVGQEIDVFSDALELSEKIKFYLHQPLLRQQMAENAYQRCVPAYSYDQRSQDIAQIIAAKGS